MTQELTIKSVELGEEELEKINAFTRTPFTAERLYAFTVCLCTNDIDRDYEKFSAEALNKLAELFIGKTGISDHSMRSADQKARIYDTWVEQIDGRTTADGEPLLCLKAKAYMVRCAENEQLITEIEAGIKKEVSVSCSMASAKCSVCNADRRNERCEHLPGHIYNGKEAYTLLSDATDAYEFSFVAVPAQRDAGVTKSYKISERENVNMQDIIKAFQSCDDGVTLSKEQASSAAEYIKGLEGDAKLGREYKKSLCDEVVCLCASSMPDMDIDIFKGVADIMTAKELKAFKNAFSKAKYDAAVSRQIKTDGDSRKFNQFKI